MPIKNPAAFGWKTRALKAEATIDRLTRESDEARREALEEAAKVALGLGDHIADDTFDKHDHAYKSALIGAAAAIRALKETKP